MKSKSKQILVAILIGLGLFFTSYINITAEEEKKEEVTEEITEEVETVGELEEEEATKVEEEKPRETEHWTDKISYDKLKNYKIDFDKIFEKIDKEFKKLDNLNFNKIFGQYNSFYEAVDMNKENVIKTVIGILIACVVLYITMRIFKITKK